MKKAIAIALIALMAVSAIGMMPVKVKGADADYIQGYAMDSLDGNVHYYDGTHYYAVFYAHTSEDPTDWTTSQDNGGESSSSGYTTFSWTTSSGHDPFTSPPNDGDHMYMYAEALKDGMGTKDGSQPYDHMGNGVANYTYCSNWTIGTGETKSPDQTLDNVGTFEAINVSWTGWTPSSGEPQIKSGSNWMNITVQAFRFTSYRTQSPNFNKGTYENTVGFVAHIKNKDGSWLGNYTISNFTASGTAPANSAPGATDPGSTGYWYMNLTSPTVSVKGGDSTKLANSYVVQVSALFSSGSGNSAYETTGQSNPPVPVPEFSTILIPIVATIGLFVAVTYIYHKRK